MVFFLARKLQLANYEWVEIGQDPAQFDEKFQVLLGYMKEELLRQESSSASKSPKESPEKKEEVASPKSGKDKGAGYTVFFFSIV